MGSNRYKLKPKRDEFVKKHPEYRFFVMNHKSGGKKQAAEPLIKCVELAREEIGYSDKTNFADIVCGLSQSYADVY